MFVIVLIGGEPEYLITGYKPSLTVINSTLSVPGVGADCLVKLLGKKKTIDDLLSLFDCNTGTVIVIFDELSLEPEI